MVFKVVPTTHLHLHKTSWLTDSNRAMASLLPPIFKRSLRERSCENLENVRSTADLLQLQLDSGMQHASPRALCRPGMLLSRCPCAWRPLPAPVLSSGFTFRTAAPSSQLTMAAPPGSITHALSSLSLLCFSFSLPLCPFSSGYCIIYFIT